MLVQRLSAFEGGTVFDRHRRPLRCLTSGFAPEEEDLLYYFFASNLGRAYGLTHISEIATHMFLSNRLAR